MTSTTTSLSAPPRFPAIHAARTIIASLAPTPEPMEQFTRLAEALIALGSVDRVTVELIDHDSIARVVRPGPGEPNGPGEPAGPNGSAESAESGESGESDSGQDAPAPRQPLLHTQQLFAGTGESILTDDAVAVAIHCGAVSSGVASGAGPDFLGSMRCEYADRPPTADDVALAGLLVTHAVNSIQHERIGRTLSEKAANLEQALATNRQIGIAIGILCARNGYDPDQAFEVLRTASQNSNRKLRDIATDVVVTATRIDGPTQLSTGLVATAAGAAFTSSSVD